VTGIFPARERPIEGVTGELIAQAVERAGGDDVRYLPDLESLPEELVGELRPGDLCLLMGAGSIEGLGSSLLLRLGEDLDA
jgi:UDP-N-acetylmuramate--alanine ligase